MANLPTLEDLIAESKRNNSRNPINGDAAVLNTEVIEPEVPVEIVEEAAQASPARESVEQRFEKKMEDLSVKNKEIEAIRFSQSIGVPHIDLDKFPIAQEALKQIPFDMARELSAVCFFVVDREIRIGALDPSMQDVQTYAKELGVRTGAHVGLYAISLHSLEKVYELYSSLPIVEAVHKDIAISEEIIREVQADVNDFASLQAFLDRKSTTDTIAIIMGAGLSLDASDVHIEAEENGIAVRFRLDGILHDVAKLPVEAYKAVISRIKLVAALKLNITDKPQDGHITITIGGDEVDVRVSTIPTVYGESVVMRLLKQNRGGLTLESLGMHPDAHKIFEAQIHRPNGMVITTGPTGSGKTTTLYAAMQVINQPGVKIITLEDPVEYKMVGVNQSQIDVSKDYTFAKGLKSMVRQDPDIAMVGEIRDLETAEVAVQAALTGHLILSTLHTNSAAGAIPRFMSMGVKPFLLAPALNCVIGQRLVRRLCETCKKKAPLAPELQERVDGLLSVMREGTVPAEREFYAPQGCEACNGIGYKGRVGIYEILVVSKSIETMILQGTGLESDIENKAIEEGMITMVQDGLLKALEGLTSAEEVFRVIE